MNKQERFRFCCILLLIVLSRIPFIINGYGSEEDAWALPLVAERIADTHIYEVSRLPGHPLQEMTYAIIWNSGPVVYNLITVLISTLGIGFFMLGLRKLSIKHWIWSGAGLAFTPLIYINSCNDMDYTWAMGFILCGFYFLLAGRYFISGLLLALAIGCRITSGAMVLPLLYLIWNIEIPQNKIRGSLKFLTALAIGTILIFIPVFANYGFSFLSYYEHFPIPSFTKNFYKGTIAVWGLPGCIALLIAGITVIIKKKITNPIILNSKDISKSFLIFCLLSIFLFVVAYIKYPLKAAFLVPMMPFVWAVFSMLLNFENYKRLVIIILISAFSFGVNLSDPLRGSTESNFTTHAIISGQKVVFDPLNGPVIADQTKRQQQMIYVKKVLSVTDTIQNPTYIIAGWWLAEILVLQKGNENKKVTFGYYTDESELEKYKKDGFDIFYLPEQDNFNDLRFQKIFTMKYAKFLDTGFHLEK